MFALVASLAVGSRPVGANGFGQPVFGIVPGNGLIRFDSATPGTVTTIGTVSGLGANETIRGIDFRPRSGQLYATTVATGSSANSVLRTYVLDPHTGAATFIGATAAALAGAGDVPTGYDFNPTVDRIRYVNTNDENARLNPNNGSLAGNDTDLTLSSTTIIAAAYDRNFDRQLVVAPANNAIPTTLYVIDRTTSTLSIQGGIDGTPSPNGGVITNVAILGFTLNASNDGGFDIIPGPQQLALAALTAANDNLTRLYAIDLDGAANVATPIGLIGNGAIEVRSIAIVPDRIEVVGADGRTELQVRVFDAGVPKFDFSAYGPKFKGGVRVAAGDVNGDGVYDIITGAGRGMPAHVRVFDGITGLPLTSILGSFVAFGPEFTGGVFVASGDINGDGFDDIIVGADAGDVPQVRAFNSRTGAQLASFLAYPADFRGGVRVASGDVNADGLAEIITAAGPGASPQVKVFAAGGSSELFNFSAFESEFEGGVQVASGDVNGDGRADIITGAGAKGGPHVKVFSGTDVSVLQDFAAFTERAPGGVRVGSADVNEDGRPDVVVGFAPRGGSQVRAFDGRTRAELQNFFVFGRKVRGVFVGG
jgi:hypothetical protein